MAQPKDILQREYTKFIESPTRPGNSAVEIAGNVAVTSPLWIPTNAICYTYEVVTDGPYYIEQYKFYSGGTPIAPTGLIKTISIYYQDSELKREIGGVVS
jgi:hypothetical protein